MNKIDTLETETDKQRVIEYVSQNASKALGNYLSAVPIFPVSARQALAAKLVTASTASAAASTGEEGLSGTGTGVSTRNDVSTGPAADYWAKSNVGVLEEYLHSVLGEKELITSKLRNPLIVADRLLSEVYAHLLYSPYYACTCHMCCILFTLTE